jgi:hypothetical protein
VDPLVEQLDSLARHLLDVAGQQPSDTEAQLDALDDAVGVIARSWSGSSVGYHADVYYKGLNAPPPGRHFSSEWGLMGSMAPGTSGEWCEYDPDRIKAVIRERAGEPDLEAARKHAKTCIQALRDGRSRFDSMITTRIAALDDSYLAGLRTDANELIVLGYTEAVAAQLPAGPIMSRDAVAISAGLRAAPHQQILGEIVEIRSPVGAVRELARIVNLASEHIVRSTGQPVKRIVPAGTHVFIGHGRSLQWMKLKEFIQDRLGPCGTSSTVYQLQVSQTSGDSARCSMPQPSRSW